MKRSEMLKLMTNVVLDDLSECKLNEKEADRILKAMEAVGITPPSVRVVTPMGSRICFDVNEWEENINIDEAGYEFGEGPDGLNAKKAEIRK